MQISVHKRCQNAINMQNSASHGDKSYMNKEYEWDKEREASHRRIVYAEDVCRALKEYKRSLASMNAMHIQMSIETMNQALYDWEVHYGRAAEEGK